MKMRYSLLLLVVGLLSACGSDYKKPESNAYETLLVQTSDVTISQSYSAVVQGRQNVEIRPRVGGAITQICIAEGAKVRKGQTLFIIDQAPYQAAVKTAQANVASAQAKLATAKLNEESRRSLMAEGIVSDFELKQAQNARLEAEALVAQAQAALSNAQNDLSYTVVKSPVDGAASMIPYRVGALVSPSTGEPLVTVSDDSEVYAYFSMTENEMLDLMAGGRSMEEVLSAFPAVEFRLSNGTLYTEKGKVDAISGVLNPTTGSVSLRATFENPGRTLRNGSTGRVVVPVSYKDCIVIPQAATFQLQDKVFVYKVQDGTAHSAPIEVRAVSDAKRYVVLSGLSAGEEIIASGAGLVKEGAKVEKVAKKAVEAPSESQK